jgi:diguanylate cyclase (GGDEF)-like protein
VALERSDLYQKSEDLRRISITDPLTELYNRRFFQDRLTEEIERAKRHSQSLSLIMLDIDNFKNYNDTHGHLAGDEALRIAATILENSVRNIDVVARYGGEEFAVVLPGCSSEEAEVVLDILGDAQETQILSLSDSGRVAEYLLRYRVTYRLRDKAQKEWIPISEILIRRDYTYDDQAVLAKENEQYLLFQAMRDDAVRQMIRRLSQARAPSGPPANDG